MTNFFLMNISIAMMLFPAMIFTTTLKIHPGLEETFKASGFTLWIMHLLYIAGVLINIMIISYYISL